MEKLEIYKDVVRINEDVQRCNNLKVQAQSVFDECKKMNLTLSVQELSGIIWKYSGVGNSRRMSRQEAIKSGKEAIIDMVKDAMISRTGSYSIGGIEIDTAKMKDLVKIPSFDDLFAILDRIDPDNRGFTMYLGVDNDALVLVDGYQEKITAKYTEYAVGAKQIEYAQRLIRLRDELNSYIEFAGVRYWIEEDIPGLVYDRDFKFKIDTHYIKGRL